LSGIINCTSAGAFYILALKLNPRKNIPANMFVKRMLYYTMTSSLGRLAFGLVPALDTEWLPAWNVTSNQSPIVRAQEICSPTYQKPVRI
jgi:hypothetical protein